MALVQELISRDDTPTPAFDMQDVLERQRAAFVQDGPTTLEHRLEALDKIKGILIMHKDAWAEAISADFGNRARQETLMAARKPQNRVEQYREMCEHYHRHGISCHAGYIIGQNFVLDGGSHVAML